MIEENKEEGQDRPKQDPGGAAKPADPEGSRQAQGSPQPEGSPQQEARPEGAGEPEDGKDSAGDRAGDDADPKQDDAEAENDRVLDEAEALMNEMRRKIADLEDDLLRAKAEAENTRRRMDERMEERINLAKSYSVTAFAESMLEVRDALEKALAHKDPGASAGLIQGVELTLKMLDSKFERQDVRKIEALGVPFDPELHEAIGTVQDPTAEPNTVLDVHIPGFTIANRVLRAASVVVSKKPPEEKADPEPPEDSPGPVRVDLTDDGSIKETRDAGEDGAPGSGGASNPA